MTEKETEIERRHVHLFNRENGNPVLDLIKYVINHYIGTAKLVTNNYGKKIVSSCNYHMVGHTASGSDIYIVLNPLTKSNTTTKKLKTSRGLTKMKFRAGSVSEDDREIPKDMKFVCSNCHISGSLKNIQKENKIQRQLLKGKITHGLITLSQYKQHETVCELHLFDDVLGLIYVISKHGNAIQKTTSVSYRNSSTEPSLAWVC